MLTGRRAFEGKSQISVASAILEKEPEPITKLLPMAPLAVDHVVQDRLAKNPDARWQNAADIARQLRWIASSGSGLSTLPAVQPTPDCATASFWRSPCGAVAGSDRLDDLW